MSKITSISFSLAVAISLFVSGAAQAKYQYEVIDLGVLGDTFSRAYGINDYGQVVVTTRTGSTYNGAIWQPTTPNGKIGTLTSLGSLGGTANFVTNINNLGQISGVATDSSGTYQAVIWQPSAANTNTGTLNSIAGIPLSQGLREVGINDQGQLVGTGGQHSFLWTPGTPNGLTGTSTTLAVGNYGGATAINSSGQITGFGDFGPTYGTYRFTPSTPNGSTGSVTRVQSVGGSPFASSGGGYDINDSGTIGGYYFAPDNHYHGFLWNGTTVTDITPGALQAGTLGVNNFNSAVGYFLPTSGAEWAFLYESGALTDLNTLIDPSSGWQLATADDINNHGQIVGAGYLNGVEHAYLLAPAAAPEPGTLGLLALGMLGGIAARRRKGVKA